MFKGAMKELRGSTVVNIDARVLSCYSGFQKGINHGAKLNIEVWRKVLFRKLEGAWKKLVWFSGGF